MTKDQGFFRSIWELRRLHRAGHDVWPTGELADAGLTILRRWQLERLERTHADLLADPQYGPACRFFMSDIYAPRDFSQRDQDFEQLNQALGSLLPGPLLEILERVIELNSLTDALDRHLLAQLAGEIEATGHFTAEEYAAAYRRCDNYEARVRQIDMLVQLGEHLDRVVRFPLTGMALRVARIPSRRSGWSAVQDFLERGYAAFSHIEEPAPFLNAISHRERTILDRIYAGVLDPFSLEHDLPRT